MQRTDDEVPESRQRFNTLYRSFYQAIYAYVWRRTADGRDEVPDVVAEVFMVAWRRMDAIPLPPHDRLWLYGVAQRLVLDHQRRSARRLRLESRLRTAASSERDEASGRDRSCLRLQAAIEGLRPRDREILRLVMWDGLSHTEAGEVLGCTANAIALRLHKAKARLKAELAEESLRYSPPPRTPHPNF